MVIHLLSFRLGTERAVAESTIVKCRVRSRITELITIIEDVRGSPTSGNISIRSCILIQRRNKASRAAAIGRAILIQQSSALHREQQRVEIPRDDVKILSGAYGSNGAAENNELLKWIKQNCFPRARARARAR